MKNLTHEVYFKLKIWPIVGHTRLKSRPLVGLVSFQKWPLSPSIMPILVWESPPGLRLLNELSNAIVRPVTLIYSKSVTAGETIKRTFTSPAYYSTKK